MCCLDKQKISPQNLIAIRKLECKATVCAICMYPNLQWREYPAYVYVICTSDMEGNHDNIYYKCRFDMWGQNTNEVHETTHYIYNYIDQWL